MKDRYRRKGSMRSFIEPSQSGREEVVKRIIPIKETIEGKEVIVVDDSVVRGTSSKIIVDSLKKAGREEGEDGGDLPADRLSVLHGRRLPEPGRAPRPPGGQRGQRHRDHRQEGRQGDRRQEFQYNDIEGLSQAIGLPKDSMCFACINGDYSKLGINPRFKTRKEMKG